MASSTPCWSAARAGPKSDADGGAAYTNRIVTLALLFLGAVTVVLVVAAPLVMRLYLNSSYNDPGLAAQRDSAIAFARLCLPQVFFYGMFVLLGRSSSPVAGSAR